MNSRALGAAVAVAVFLADQAAKVAVLTNPPAAGQSLAPFLDLALRLNRGISFSLFVQESAFGKGVLLALTLGATALLGWWLSRSRSTLVAIGLGSIIGGALGNAADRILRGGVVDYLDLHAFGRHFFVFNLADAAINVGVALLLVEVMFGSRGQSQVNKPASPASR